MHVQCHLPLIFALLLNFYGEVDGNWSGQVQDDSMATTFLTSDSAGIVGTKIGSGKGDIVGRKNGISREEAGKEGEKVIKKTKKGGKKNKISSKSSSSSSNSSSSSMELKNSANVQQEDAINMGEANFAANVDKPMANLNDKLSPAFTLNGSQQANTNYAVAQKSRTNKKVRIEKEGEVGNGAENIVQQMISKFEPEQQQQQSNSWPKNAANHLENPFGSGPKQSSKPRRVTFGGVDHSPIDGISQQSSQRAGAFDRPAQFSPSPKVNGQLTQERMMPFGAVPQSQFEFGANSPSHESYRHPSMRPADPEAEYRAEKLRQELEYAERRPEIWLVTKDEESGQQGRQWKCQEAVRHAECTMLMEMHGAIRRYIAFERAQLDGVNGDELLKKVAVKPLFRPAFSNGKAAKVGGLNAEAARSQTIAVNDVQLFEGNNLHNRRTGTAMFVEHGAMELVQVMRMVELAFSARHNGYEYDGKPVEFLNQELIKSVQRWAQFFSDAIEAIKSGRQMHKIWQFEGDDGAVLRMVQNKEDFEREAPKARQILVNILAGTGAQVPSAPIPLESALGATLAGSAKFGQPMGGAEQMRRQQLAQQWKPIVDTLANEKARRTGERYAARQKEEEQALERMMAAHGGMPMNGHDGILLVPLPEEIVLWVYLNLDGTPLGADLDQAYAKAITCLRVGNQGIISLSELEAECPVPPIMEVGRQEQYEEWAQIGRAMLKGANNGNDIVPPPVYLTEDGDLMESDAVLAKLAEAFDALVHGRKLPAYVPRVQKKRTEALVAWFEAKKDKVEKRPIEKNEEYRQFVNGRIAEYQQKAAAMNNTKGDMKKNVAPKGPTEAQKFFNKKVKEVPKIVETKKGGGGELSEKRKKLDAIFGARKQQAKSGADTNNHAKGTSKKAFLPATHHRAGF